MGRCVHYPVFSTGSLWRRAESYFQRGWLRNCSWWIVSPSARQPEYCHTLQRHQPAWLLSSRPPLLDNSQCCAEPPSIVGTKCTTGAWRADCWPPTVTHSGRRVSHTANWSGSDWWAHTTEAGGRGEVLFFICIFFHLFEKLNVGAEMLCFGSLKKKKQRPCFPVNNKPWMGGPKQKEPTNSTVTYWRNKARMMLASIIHFQLSWLIVHSPCKKY